jgi:hypothetical protein
MVDAGGDCKHHATWKLGLLQRPTKDFIENAKVLKTPPFLIHFVCFTLPLPPFGCLLHQWFYVFDRGSNKWVFINQFFHQLTSWFE